MIRTYTHLREGRAYSGTVDVCPEDGGWSVYVNGQRLVDRESFTLAKRIADGIVMPGVHYPSEACEVSTSILAWLISNRA